MRADAKQRSPPCGRKGGRARGSLVAAPHFGSKPEVAYALPTDPPGWLAGRQAVAHRYPSRSWQRDERLR